MAVSHEPTLSLGLPKTQCAAVPCTLAFTTGPHSDTYAAAYAQRTPAPLSTL